MKNLWKIKKINEKSQKSMKNNLELIKDQWSSMKTQKRSIDNHKNGKNLSQLFP